MANANPAPDVLADLLSEAAETGRLMVALQLLRDLAGPGMVKAAVGICIDRRRAALARLDTRPPGRGDAAAAHRDTTPKASAERSGSPAKTSEAALHLVRRLPDPLTGGPAGQADR